MSAASPRVLVGVSGAIAAYKSADIVRGLRRAGAEVHVALTRNAEHFVTPFLLGNLAGRPAITSQYEPEHADVQHVNLAFEVDLMLVAPASADVIAKLAHGLADDFITTFHLATPAPLLLAPAMNTRMWEHPATRANVATLRGRGVRLVGPVEGELATLHSGLGRMAEPEAVVHEALRILAGGGTLDGQVVLVSAGRTEEDLDLARTLTNRSTGRMGYAVAAEAHARGAETILVSGPTELAPPPGVELHRVRSASEMRTAMLKLLERATVVVMAAAVADFRPRAVAARKIKKDEAGALRIDVERTPDILSEIGEQKGGRVVVGFAAEDSAVEARAREKLERKRLDLVVGNDISHADRGFAAEENEVIIVGVDGFRLEVSKRPKRAIAASLLDQVTRLLAARPR